MTELPLRDVFGNYLVEIGKKNKSIVVLDADLSSSTRTAKFAKVYPKRFFNMGIAEQNMLGTALGFAISGKIPVVSGFSIFTTGRAWEFIRLACHDNLNLKIITTHSGCVGEDGSTHHSFEDISLMATLPNLTVLVPADSIELYQMLNIALSTRGPFYIRLPRGIFPQLHDDNYKFSIGKPDVIKQGSDYCLITTGYGTVLAYHCAREIEKHLNISLKIINLPSIKPINEKDLLSNLEDIKGIVVIEEHNIYCGVGSIIARIISANHPTSMKFIGINNSFGQSGKRELVLDDLGLNKQNILIQIEALIKAQKI